MNYSSPHIDPKHSFLIKHRGSPRPVARLLSKSFLMLNRSLSNPLFVSKTIRLSRWSKKNQNFSLAMYPTTPSFAGRHVGGRGGSVRPARETDLRDGIGDFWPHDFGFNWLRVWIEAVDRLVYLEQNRCLWRVILNRRCSPRDLVGDI
jgi:hypothetical protein